MFRIFACVTQQHNLWLVLVAALICVVGVGATFFVLDLDSSGQARSRHWRIMAAVMAAGTTWATHFVSILAYDPGLPTGYELGPTLVSALIGLVFAIAAFEAMARFAGRDGRVLAGVLLGIGISGLHYVGMLGLDVSADRVWDSYLVVASGASCALFAWLALEAAALAPKRYRLWAASGLLVLSICSLHFTGMGALTLVPNPLVTASKGNLDRQSLAAMISVCAAAVLAIAFTVSLADRRIAAVRAAENRRIQRMADAAYEGIVFHDGRQVLDANAQFAALVNIPHKDIVGTQFSSLLTQDVLSKIAQDLVANGSSLVEASMRQGEKFADVEIHTRVYDAKAVLLISSVRDISARNRAEAAERANNEKSQFLANMSHELRTPLNAILGYAEILAEDAADRDDANAVRDAQRIRDAGSHLLSLINEILDLSKIEAGKIEIAIADSDLSALAKEIVATMGPLAETKGNTIKLNVEHGLQHVPTDAFRLKQCLLNLMSNALKFTENGAVTLNIRHASHAGDQHVEICVSDSGIGMSAAQMERLFQPFMQADASIAKRFGGTGLGLTITQRLIVLLGGSIRAESTLGVGTKFTISLPLARVAPSAAMRSAA